MKLPYDEAGRGSALILLHAGVADRRMWRDHLHALADAGYRAVALDLPGFGEAPLPAGELAPWSDVLETMESLGIERAALVGNSLGGAVALRVALLAPDRVTALALISVPPPEFEPSEALRAAWAAESEAIERGDIDAAVEAVLDAWLVPDAPGEVRERVADMQRRAFEAQATLGGDSMAPDPLEQEPGRLAEIAAPALVAAGAREFSDFREGAEAMAHALPEARHAVIEAAGHLAPLETPEEFRALLLDFLVGTS